MLFRSAPAKKPAAKKTPAKKTAAKKAPAKKPTAAKKAAVKKAPAKKPAAKKAAAKKPVAKKAPAKRTAAKKSIDAQPSAESGSFIPYQQKKNEDYMNEAQRAHFREILLDWKRQLMEEVDRTMTHMQDEAAHYPDPADRASQEEEFSLELKTRDRERKLIKKIDNTLELIDQDNYGYCESCGVEIGIRRLEARPTATQCIDCKTIDEIKERQILG